MCPRESETIYVLVIEYDRRLREFLADQLMDRGYKVMTADNGADAVECVQNSKFHVAISDLRLSNFETLQAIRTIDPQIQVIVVGGYGCAEIAMEAMKRGAYYFYQKPIIMQELFHLIEKAYASNENIFRAGTLEGLLEDAMDKLQTLFHADEGSFMLMDSYGDLYIACSRGLPAEAVYATALKLGERVAGLAAKEGQEFLINGDLENYKEFRGIEKKRRIQSSIVVPIYCQQKLIGVLNLNRKVSTQNFTENDLKGVSIFVSQISQAVRDAKLRSDFEAKTRELRSVPKRSR